MKGGVHTCRHQQRLARVCAVHNNPCQVQSPSCVRADDVFTEQLVLQIRQHWNWTRQEKVHYNDFHDINVCAVPNDTWRSWMIPLSMSIKDLNTDGTGRTGRQAPKGDHVMFRRFQQAEIFWVAESAITTGVSGMSKLWKISKKVLNRDV